MNVSKSVPDCTDLWTDISSNCWPPDEYHFVEVFAVCSRIQTDDPPLWTAFLHQPLALLPSEKTEAMV